MILLLAIPALLIGVALFTNLYREHRRYHIQLKPNCLLTRAPIVFVTGPRSVFYFRKYWNAYPEVLAEHGYEVFTLHLPWRNSVLRRQRLQEFLQRHRNRRYHFICDSWTKVELGDCLTSASTCASLSVLPEVTDSPTRSRFLWGVYRLHRHWVSNQAPSAEQLGLQFPQSASWLLNRAQELGEQDFAGV